MVVALGVVTLIGVVAAGGISLFRLFGEKPVKASAVTAFVLLFGFFVIRGMNSAQVDRVLEMLGTVFISVSVCIGLWVVLNLLVSQASRRWSVFSGIVGAVSGAALFGLLRGNKSVGPLISDVAPEFAAVDPLLLNDAVGTGLLGHLEWPLVGALLLGGGSFAIKSLPNQFARLGLAAVVGAVAAWLVATNTRILQRPDPDWVAIIAATAILGAIGAGLGYLSGRIERGALLGAGVGWLVGGWLLSPFEQVVEVPYISTIVPFVLIMMGFSWQETPTPRERARFDGRARAVVFLLPALGFLLASLVVPALRTAVLSFQNRQGEGFVGLENYRDLFTAEASVDTSVTVATVVGLAVAVLADRAVWGQNLAKSLIFMPMAISLVGASIVWRLQYQPKDISKNQTGVLNAIWVELGQLSNSGLPRLLIIVVLAVLTGWMLVKIVQRLQSDRPFTGVSILLVIFGWLLYRFIGPRLGGFTTNAQGELEPETIQFLTEQPFNNVWLMVILIWMQTGFAMVIFSAAIKAVPQEFVEAAKVDGATESQTFFNVTLPSILPTVGVVVTTMIVQVTKVYDIVAVAGLNGIFGNNVLANQMFTESFLNLNRGFGAAIAMVMFLLVLPVMVYNIYNMQKEAI